MRSGTLDKAVVLSVIGVTEFWAVQLMTVSAAATLGLVCLHHGVPHKAKGALLPRRDWQLRGPGALQPSKMKTSSPKTLSCSKVRGEFLKIPPSGLSAQVSPEPYRALSFFPLLLAPQGYKSPNYACSITSPRPSSGDRLCHSVGQTSKQLSCHSTWMAVYEGFALP